MAEHDLHSQVKVFQALEFTAAAGAETVGEVIDTDGFESIEFFVSSGTITTGEFDVSLDSDSVVGFSSPTAIPAALILGALPNWLVGDDDIVRRVGTVVKEQFVRMTLDGGDTPVGQFYGFAVLSNPKTLPVPDQSITPV